MLLSPMQEMEGSMARATGTVSSVEVTGPLAAFVEAFEAELSARGYALRTIVNHIRQVGG
jgi:hypothetical protein